jgi:F-type H+-transporting ATPase subunit b
MGIDGFTLVAQIANFLLLLFLLRLFLFRPVKRVMQARERRIAEEHQAAERALADAEERAAELAAEREAFARERHERLAAVAREVEEVREKRLDEVAAEAEAAREAWREDMRRQTDDLTAALRRETAEVLGDALRSGWRELADEDLEARALTTFAQRLRALDDDTRRALAEAAGRGPLRIATAFEPSEAQRTELLQALDDALGKGGEVEADFERDPELLAGVTLRAGDRRVGWSVRHQVDALQRAWAEGSAMGGAATAEAP